MRRMLLKKRLGWLTNDPAYWVYQVLKLRRVTMASYFGNDIRAIKKLSDYTNIPLLDLLEMPYASVAEEIAALYRQKSQQVYAICAAWLLARKFIPAPQDRLQESPRPSVQPAGRKRDARPLETEGGKRGLRERISDLPKERLAENSSKKLFYKLTHIHEFSHLIGADQPPRLPHPRTRGEKRGRVPLRTRLSELIAEGNTKRFLDRLMRESERDAGESSRLALRVRLSRLRGEESAEDPSDPLASQEGRGAGGIRRIPLRMRLLLLTDDGNRKGSRYRAKSPANGKGRRIRLKERLRAVPPMKQARSFPLSDMTLRTYVNVINHLMPEQKHVLYRLICCGREGACMDSTLGEIFSRTERGRSDVNDALVYDVLIRPYEAMAKEAKEHGKRTLDHPGHGSGNAALHAGGRAVRQA